MLGKHKQTLKEKIQRKKKLRDDIDEQRTIKIEQEREEVKNEKSI
jgi:hypothetical protein